MKKALLTTVAFAALLFAGGTLMAQSVTAGNGSAVAPEVKAAGGVVFTNMTTENMETGTVITHGPSTSPVEAKQEAGRMTIVPATGAGSAGQRSSGSASSLGDSPKE